MRGKNRETLVFHGLDGRKPAALAAAPEPIRARKPRTETIIPRVDFTLHRPMPAASEWTLLRVHRGPKTSRVHSELQARVDGEARAQFDEVPAGHYALLVKSRGHRPYATLVELEAGRASTGLHIPQIPVESEAEENDLLRVGEEHPFVEETRQWLRKFGYLREACRCRSALVCSHLENALRLFQKRNHLDVRGTLTLEVLRLMLLPRCGRPDITEAPLASNAGPPGTESQDPIAFTGNRWDSNTVGFRIGQGTGDISNEWDVVRAALQTWHSSSALSFNQTESSNPDLSLDFLKPSDPGYSFDQGGSKSSNTLAHAWGPLDGRVEFDDYEDWGSTSLIAVATHEIGHALGLAHSSVKDATMYAWYDRGQSTLHEVDVRGIKSLYAPVVRSNGPFIAVPLFAFQNTGGSDSVIIDLGTARRFLAWGTVTMVDSLADYDRDNMHYVDVYEVDGNRTTWCVSGGDHYGSAGSPGNVYQGAFVGVGRTVKMRLVAGHVDDLEVAGYALVLVLSAD